MKKYYYAIMVGIAVIIIVLLATVVLFNIRKANVKYGNQTLENTAVEEDKAIEKINNEVVHTNSWAEKISPNAIIIFNKNIANTVNQPIVIHIEFNTNQFDGLS